MKNDNIGFFNTEPSEKTEKKKTSLKSVQEKLKPLIFIGPHLLFFIVFFIFPFFFGIAISFTSWSVDYPLSSIKWAGFDNFKAIWNLKEAIDPDIVNEFSENFFGGLKYTALYTVVMVPLIIVIPMIFALVLNNLRKGRGLVQAVLYAPSLLSVATVALTWRWMFDQEAGFFNNTIFLYNPIKFTTDYPWLCIFIFTLWSGVGGNLIIFLAGLSGIPETYYEAADIDGANSWVKFWKITLPEMSFQLLYTSVMGTIGAFNVYGQPAMFGVVQDKWVLMQHIQNYAFGTRRDVGAGYASAMAVSLGLIISLFSGLQFKIMESQD